MKSTRIFTPLLPIALASLLLPGGCNKQNQQPGNTQQAAASQPAVPAPPADQTGAAPQQSASPSGGTAAASPAAPAPPPPLVIPAGTHIAVTIQQDLGSKISQAGQTFTATVTTPVTVDGARAIRAGASASGTVVDAKPLGRFKGGAYLELRLDTVRADGATYQISTNALERVEKGKGKRTAKFVGGGAGLGALIGGIAGGGKGALIGALAGGGAGTAGAGLTGQKDIVIPAETTLTFRLSHAVQVSR